MRDQANSLRSLASLRSRPLAPGGEARWTGVLGGVAGAGATTLSVQMALALSRAGVRTIVLDAAAEQGGVARQLGNIAGEGIGEVLAAKRDLYEVLQRGPSGLQYVSGGALGGEPTERGIQRLLRQIQTLERHADAIVLDLGSRIDPLVQYLWSAASSGLLVTTPDPAAVIDSYAAIKGLPIGPSAPRGPRLVVNFTESEQDGWDVHHSIDQAAQRFLGARLLYGGAIPRDERVASAERHGAPLLVRHPHSGYAVAVERIASALLQEQSAAGELQRAA
jgi:flagellar biosynthesis protein FlhG